MHKYSTNTLYGDTEGNTSGLKQRFKDHFTLGAFLNGKSHAHIFLLLPLSPRKKFTVMLNNSIFSNINTISQSREVSIKTLQKPSEERDRWLEEWRR
jgi:hypothetical protein